MHGGRSSLDGRSRILAVDDEFAGTAKPSIDRPLKWTRVEKLSLTCYVGAEDGIRTRDPHLGKVFELVHSVLASPPSWPPVYGMSSESARIQPCCRAVYYGVATVERPDRGPQLVREEGQACRTWIHMLRALPAAGPSSRWWRHLAQAPITAKDQTPLPPPKGGGRGGRRRPPDRLVTGTTALVAADVAPGHLILYM
jgi:hypothetical protein